ncbi:Abscisic acid 8'-hydroxylase 1 [Glycine max]|nr:Abscisic acid 8'-hydroxylase 1 [Glycine max]
MGFFIKLLLFVCCYLMQFTFNVALLSIFGKDENLYGEALKRCYCTLERGYNSMPINLPGTLFHKAMKARKELAQILAQIISTRRNMKQDHNNDLLGSFMSEKAGLTDEQIADNIIGAIFAARDTTATVLTWIVKYLGENPSVLEAVTEEQESLLRGKEESGEKMGLNWSDTKNMPVTSRVIQETLRIASILSFTFREAVEDVEFQGYLIPKRWKVLPLFRNIHHSPDNFKEPEKFDPSRFEVAPKPNTFMPFGNGTRACPGNELANLEILVVFDRCKKWDSIWPFCHSTEWIAHNTISQELNITRIKSGGTLTMAWKQLAKYGKITLPKIFKFVNQRK